MTVSPPDGHPFGQPSEDHRRAAGHEGFRMSPTLHRSRRRIIREMNSAGLFGVHIGELPPNEPRNRTILAVDIESSTTRNNATKVKIREAMYDLLKVALTDSGIGEGERDPLVDRGDGALALIHPVDQAPKTALLNRVIPTLTRLLAEYCDRTPELSFRLRVMIHAGEVHHDSYGWSGRALDLGCRLLDSKQLKQALKLTRAPLVLVVSDEIYHQVVQQGYDGIDDASFQPTVRVRIDGRLHKGWVQVPKLPPLLSVIR
jgi:hypothetical protein